MNSSATNSRAAILSVSNKEGLEEFAKGLAERGFTLLASGGTGRFLKEAGLEVVSIEEYTGQAEILEGRVKTLHPKVHGGLLARQPSADHMAQLESADILPIQVAAVNLYPFAQHLASDTAQDPAKMIELVDIGGPTMLRSAAKNFESVFSVIDPADYPRVLEALDASEAVAGEVRRELAVKVFKELANYNALIARYFSSVVTDEEGSSEGLAIDHSYDYMLGGAGGVVLERSEKLRYGENPHQAAALYTEVGQGGLPWVQHNGKKLSYNNLLDFDAAAKMVLSLPSDTPAAVIVKHLNPCGAACRDTLAEALIDAKKGDPRSHFGGVIALNQPVDEATAQQVIKDFAEIVVAPKFTDEALTVLKKKKNLRVVELTVSEVPRFELRSVGGGYLIQENDLKVSDINEAKVVSEGALTDTQKRDLQLAWTLCAHVKSNALAIVKDGMLLTTGAGQMSRIDSAEVALLKAKIHEHDLQGAVCASDAFFPFPDCVELLGEAGVTAVIAPGGAMKDAEVIAQANESGVVLLHAGDRHFRH